jgi:hypothetical protein
VWDDDDDDDYDYDDDDDDDDVGDDDDNDDVLLTLQSVFISLTHAHYRPCAQAHGYRTTHLTRTIDETENKQ